MTDELTLNLLSPVRHNITPDRVVFCYRDGDADSLEVARHYRDTRGVPNRNLIALPTTDANIINESDLVTTIEIPLLTALQAIEKVSGGGSEGSQFEKQIWVIILGYNIPHAFYPDDDPYMPLMAIVSRLHKLGLDVSTKFLNHTFDRKDFRYFDPDDANLMYLTAIIDASTKDKALGLINRSLDVDAQTFVAGKIFVDPYGKQQTLSQNDYESDILEFLERDVGKLGLTTVVTVDTEDPYTEPTVRAFEEDSFYWGWFQDRFAPNLFFDQNQRRVFLYNADNDGGADIGAPLDFDNGSDRWVNIGINIEPGYASMAGTVSAPGEDSYLRPRPFFEAMHRGASLAECFLYSSRYVNWKMVLIGDPLMVTNFPNLFVEPTLTNDEAIQLMKKELETGIAWGARQSKLTLEATEFVVASTDLIEEVNLLLTVNKWRLLKGLSVQLQLFSFVSDQFADYVFRTTTLSFPDWLEDRGKKTTSLMTQLIDNISSTSVYPAGQWEFEFIYTHPRLVLENINFILEVATDKDFVDIFLTLKTRVSVIGWEYEKELFEFTALPENGLPSNYSSRRVRFTSPASNFLRKLETYYVRVSVPEDDPYFNGEILKSKQIIISR